ncbi:MAG: CDP-alcohol phosphatidyltransferase family protein [Polyangiaceae bacterium]|nr:CDP-alcohol phosphatidyltransferase family protein [Polyangiaceae bacterium]
MSPVGPPSPPPFVVVGEGEAYGLRCGGVVVLERALRALAKQGHARATVAAPELSLRADLPISVDWVARDTPPPDGAEVVRGDEVAGVRVIDRATCEQAEWELCLGLSKSHQGLIDGLINWRFSVRITRLLSSTRVTPNQITAVSFVTGLAGSALLLGGSHLSLAMGGVLIQAQSILDSCDGELARLRFQGSKLGQWLDNVTDDVLDLTFICCAAIAAGGAWTAPTLAFAAVRAVAQVFVYHEVYRRTGTGDLYAFRIWFDSAKETVDEVYDKASLGIWIRSLGRRDTYVFCWMLLCIANQVQVVALWGIILGVLIGGLMSFHLVLRQKLPPRPA